MKAPFRLTAGVGEADLLILAAAFAAGEQPLALPGLAVRPLGNFLALQLPPDCTHMEAVSGLAMRCVRQFDVLRAPPSAAELARRRQINLTARQNALLARWGYPYTEEEFRLHFTLSDEMASLSADQRQAVRAAAETSFAPALAQCPQIDGISIFREPAPGELFMLWRRFVFQRAALPV